LLNVHYHSSYPHTICRTSTAWIVTESTSSLIASNSSTPAYKWISHFALLIFMIGLSHVRITRKALDPEVGAKRRGHELALWARTRPCPSDLITRVSPINPLSLYTMFRCLLLSPPRTVPASFFLLLFCSAVCGYALPFLLESQYDVLPHLDIVVYTLISCASFSNYHRVFSLLIPAITFPSPSIVSLFLIIGFLVSL
jgi:hypothetical protein